MKSIKIYALFIFVYIVAFIAAWHVIEWKVPPLTKEERAPTIEEVMEKYKDSPSLERELRHRNILAKWDTADTLHKTIIAMIIALMIMVGFIMITWFVAFFFTGKN